MQVNNSFFLTITFTLILLFGLTFVASSSVFEGFELSGDPFYFAKRQFIFVIIGIISMLIILNIPSHNYAKFDWLIIIFCFLLLLALFVPNIGKVVNGSLRWIDLGLFNLQPSELAKFGLIIYVSGYCVRRSNQISTIFGFVRPLMVVSLFSSAIIFQPDLGSVVIIFCVILSLLFLAGISIGQFSLLVLVLSVLAYIAVRHEPYRYARLISFTDPFAPEFEERSGYQLSNALIGIGRGEFFGVGLGNSIQKNAYLPEPHTDFIFAIILEETGILGGLALIFLFIFLLFLILKISNESFKIKNSYQGFLCFGIATLIAIQTIFNLGVNLGLLPTKGLTLPFVSYGGASLITFMAMIAIVLRIDYENRSY